MTHLEEIEALKKEIDILRDQAQIDRLELDKAYSTNTTLLNEVDSNSRAKLSSFESISL